MKNELHIVLKKLREQEGKTQAEIAKNVNITQRAYAFYEKGDREPSIDTLIKLADYFKVPIDVLVGRYKM